ncbi:hypothetical protein X975_05974, partial [Stegodyphus mimosarum]
MWSRGQPGMRPKREKTHLGCSVSYKVDLFSSNYVNTLTEIILNPVKLVEEILSLEGMSLNPDGADLDELVEEHNEELTEGVLEELHKEQQQEVVEEIS